ncbi:hypothetical protein BH10PSE8_BH10PSE8_10950 [soil metagenome]
MGRRKGEVTDRQRNRSHPFQVEMVVPGTGLGNAMLIMYRWAALHDHETTRATEGAHHLMRWCFCSRDVADTFATDYGGRRLDLPFDPASLKIDRPDARELARRQRAARFGLDLLEDAR